MEELIAAIACANEDEIACRERLRVQCDDAGDCAGRR